MENKHNHEIWNIMASVLIDSGKYFDVNTCNFTDELSVVELCQRNPLLRQHISKWLSKLNESSLRTLELTNEFRLKGNAIFNEITGQNDLAADYYTKAIFSAPKNSVELALAHSNRAACSLTSDRFYEEGYFDCKLALHFNYPKSKIRKLFERKQYLANQTNKNEEYSAETYLEMKNMNIELDEQRKALLEVYQSQAKKNQKGGKNNRRDKPTCVAPNQIFKNLNLIEKFEPSVGRYLITGEAIKANEPIVCEKAFAFVPAYEYDDIDSIHYSCQCCAQINCLPFPCYDCVRASYCTPLCLSHHEPIHKYECIGYQKNLWSKLGIGHLAFRTFLIGFEEAVEKLIDKKKSTVRDVFTSFISNKQQNVPYDNVLRLVSHIDLIDPRNVLRYALTAQLMTIYLSEYTDFFDKLPGTCAEVMEDIEDWKTLVTLILLRHMAQMYFSAQTLHQLKLMPPTIYKKNYGYGSNSIHLKDLHLVIQSSSFFSAIFPNHSLINHSCDPNIRFNIDGPYLYTYAKRDIDKNDELFSCYGAHYKLLPKPNRQMRLLDHFFFECHCTKCETNDTSVMKYYEYYCPNEECGSLVEMDELDLRWWFTLDNDYTSKINHKFKCNKCDARLPMNPTMMQKFEKAARGHIDVGYTFFSTNDHIITTTLLDYYFSASKCLGKYHELKSRMAHLVLGFNVLDSKKEIFPRLAYVTMENYVNRIERYGAISLEFILVVPHALHILQLATIIERTNTSARMARDITKIRKILDIETMEKSFVILPKSLQLVFKNTLRDMGFDNYCVGELGTVRASDSDRFNTGDAFHINGVHVGDSEKRVG